MLTDLRLPLGRYVEEALASVGAEWEEDPDGVTSVLLPGEGEIRRVASEPEIAREGPGVELLAHGSRFLETLVERGLRRGRLARGFAAPAPVPPGPIARAYDLAAEQVTRSEWASRPWTTWVFAFAIRYVGEFRSEGIALAAVDARSLRLVRRFEETFTTCLILSDAGPEPEGDRPFEEAYAVARAEILGRARIGYRVIEASAREDLEREVVRQASYFGGMIEEMSGDLERLAPEDPRRTAILSRIRATRAERDRARAEAVERHATRLEVEAIGALGIVYPRQVATLVLSAKRSRAVEVEAAWDPVFEQYEPLSCPACRRPTYRLELT